MKQLELMTHRLAQEELFRQQMAARQLEKSKAIFVVRTMEPLKKYSKKDPNSLLPIISANKYVSREYLVQTEAIDI